MNGRLDLCSAKVNIRQLLSLFRLCLNSQYGYAKKMVKDDY